jgi:hypothetical protein
MNSDALNTVFTEMDEKDQKKFRKWLRGVLTNARNNDCFHRKKTGLSEKCVCTLERKTQSQVNLRQKIQEKRSPMMQLLFLTLKIKAGDRFVSIP